MWTANRSDWKLSKAHLRYNNGMFLFLLVPHKTREIGCVVQTKETAERLFSCSDTITMMFIAYRLSAWFFFPMLWFSYNHTESSSICIHSPFRIAFIPARLNWWCTPRVKASEMRNPCNQTVTNSPFLSQGCVTIGHFCHYSWDSGCTQGLAPAFQSTISQSMCISTLQGMNDGMFEKKVLAVCWVWHQPLLLDLSSCQTNCWLTTWWMVIVATYLQVQITFNWMKGWWIKSTHTAVCEGVLYVGNRKC